VTEDDAPDSEPTTDTDWDRLLEMLSSPPAEEGWVTLDEAAGAAQVSRSTLRSWYRTDQIPSRMVPSLHGPQRLVPLGAVLDRAMQSPRISRQLDAARSLEAEVNDLRRRIQVLEEYLGIGSP